MQNAWKGKIFAAAVLLALSGAWTPALGATTTKAPSAEPKLTPEQMKMQAEERRKAQEARIKELNAKIKSVTKLIDNINEELKLRTASNDVFERKRALENQLRDLITLFALTDRALTEANRLGQEVDAIRKTADKGPSDPRRLQLANFLEARRHEYILFGTR